MKIATGVGETRGYLPYLTISTLCCHVRASLCQPFPALALAVALLVVGYRDLHNAPPDVFHEFASPLVENSLRSGSLRSPLDACPKIV